MPCADYRAIWRTNRAEIALFLPLKRLHDQLTPIPQDNKLAFRVLYRCGFAPWRRAIPEDQEEDLTPSVSDFKDAMTRECPPAGLA